MLRLRYAMLAIFMSALPLPPLCLLIRYAAADAAIAADADVAAMLTLMPPRCFAAAMLLLLLPL